jgi:hypothetical protein
MNQLFEAGLEFQQFAETKGWRYCFIGGLAVIRWGEPRMTQDVDVSLLTGFGGEEPVVIEALAAFASRIADAESFALANRVLLLKAANGVPIDVSLAALPFESDMSDRATPFPFAPDASLLTCSAEDLVVLKAFADRDRDWTDVEGIITRQRGSLDVDHIFRQLTPLCNAKDAPHVIDKLRSFLA